MFKLLRLCLLLIMITCSGNAALAGIDPYGSCIKGYDFGIVPTENVILVPINLNCQKSCNNECNSFSRKDPLGIELNNAMILNCVAACQSGNKFSSYYYESTTESNGDMAKISVRGPAITNAVCSPGEQNKDVIFESSFDIVDGDEIRLNLVSSPSAANKVYMCGRKAIKLDPIMKSLNSADWISDAYQFNILRTEENMCLTLLRTGIWNGLASNKLWLPASTNPCNWNSRNGLFSDTGLWVKDGDELSLNWRSTHIFNTQIDVTSNQQNVPKFSRANLIRLLLDPNTKDSLKSAINDILNKQSAIEILRPGGDPSDFDALKSILIGTDAITDRGETQTVQSQDATPSNLIEWFGLNGSVFQSDLIAPNSSSSRCDTVEKKAKDYRYCNANYQAGVESYSFNGVLKGFADKPAKLAFRTYASTALGYANNVGGVTLDVEWGGCPYTDGERIQYIVSSSESPSDTDPWIDVPTKTFTDGLPIKLSGAGKFFLRIKPVPVDGDLPVPEQQRYTDLSYRSGQYYLNLSMDNKSSAIFKNGPIKILVKAVRSTLYGDPGNPDKPGVLKQLFKNLVQESAAVSIIRAILVLYIAFTGFGYLIGTLQMTQYDMIIRLIKFSLIAALISPGGWEFFFKNFFLIFIDGSLELIGRICQGSLEGYGLVAIDITKDPTNIFGVFDGPFKILFSKQIWLKILALSLSSILGWVLAIFIIIASVFYILAIAKATMMFLISMIIISLLIFIGPVFMCLMLFNATKGMFTIWWKYLISFTLQPVAIFAAISIFTILILATIYATLGFSICPSCLLSLNIPKVVDICLIPVWRMLAYSHFPSDSSFSFLPPGAIEGTVMLMILCQGMFIFSEFMAEIINRIISNQLANYATLQDYGTKSIMMAQTVVGMDEGSKQRSKQRRREKTYQEAQKTQRAGQTNATVARRRR